MTIGKNVHYTFDEVMKDIGDLEPNDLMKWMQVICKYYLTERDINILDALRAKHENHYKQRELSILFCIAQPHLSDNFKRIRTKIVSIYNFLQCDALFTEYLAAKAELTERQYSLMRLALAGNSFYDIAKAERVSNPDVSITFKAVVSRLSKSKKYPYLVKFLHRYKGKFVKN